MTTLIIINPGTALHGCSHLQVHEGVIRGHCEVLCSNIKVLKRVRSAFTVSDFVVARNNTQQ